MFPVDTDDMSDSKLKDLVNTEPTFATQELRQSDL